MLEYFDISPEVREAMRELVPVVVMESTVWAHGLPPEDSLKCFGECDEIIRGEGALPVTVGLENGKIRVGLSSGDIEAMIANEDTEKVNVREISSCLQRKKTGATTVSSTIFIAHKMGLPLVVTGGMGGVHRQANKTFDISADLQTLADLPVTLVASGVKSILDVGATLEVMETLGIPVVGYQTLAFPSFYSHLSPHAVPLRMDEVDDIAGMIQIHKKLGLKQGILVANPIPREDSINESLIEEVVEKAMIEANEMMVSGKHLTPFLLERLHTLTGGKTVRANIALLRSNARLGAQLSRLLYY